MKSKWISVLGAALLFCGLSYCRSFAADPSAGAEQQAQAVLQEAEQLAVAAVDRAIAEARPLLDRYGYLAVFVAVFVEGAGIPGPGEMLLIAGAIDAADGSLSIIVILVLAVAGAVLGNSLGYLIGRVGGRALLRRLPISAARLGRVEALFERYGAGFIVIARFVDGPRQLNGIMAGSLEMPWWRFSVWNLCGALLWVGVWGLGVYTLDRDLDQILALVRRVEPLAIALSVMALLAIGIYIWQRRSTNAAE